MPSQLINLLADTPGAKYGWYRFRFGKGLDAWLTSVSNRTLGTLWFPRFGEQYVSVMNPSTVVQLDSYYSGSPPMSPDQMLAVFGSAIPRCPVDINALAAVPDAGVPQPNPEGFPDPIAVPSSEPDDVSDLTSGPALPYMQVEVEYLLASAVDFVPAIRTAQAPPIQGDGCGNYFYLVGGSITLRASVDALIASSLATGTTYVWHVTGAPVSAGTVDQPSVDPSITLLLSSPGTILVSVEVTVQTEVGSGIQVVQQSTTRTAKITLHVLTESQAELTREMCRLLQETLPIRSFVFPGSPAQRPSAEQLTRLYSVGQRVQAHATRMAGLLTKVLRDTR